MPQQQTVNYLVSGGVDATNAVAVGKSIAADLATKPTLSTDSNGNVTGLMGQGYRVTPQSYGTRLRAAAAAAQQYVGYLTVAPAWAASTGYFTGQVVTNGGSDYVCLGSGTSASSGGPTVTTGASQADGTTSWSYLGPHASAVTNADIPVVTGTTTNPSATLPASYQPVSFPSAYTVLGGVASAYRGSFWQITTFNDGTGNVSRGGSIGFVTDSPIFAFFVPSNSIGIRVKIDGNYHSPSCYNNGGVDSWIKIDFSAYPKKKRKIIYECSKSVSYFGGVLIDATSSIEPLFFPNLIKAAWISDSLDAGSLYGPWLGGNRMSQQVGAKLGWQNVWGFSTGGTGYLNNATSYDTFVNRASEAAAINPDIFVIRGSTNDIGYPSASITAACVSLINSIRALSAAPICVCGVWPLNNAATSTVEAAVQAAVASCGQPDVYFIPETGAVPMPYVTGSWNNSANTQSNTSTLLISSDGTHPTDYGIQLVSSRLANDIYNVCISKQV